MRGKWYKLGIKDVVVTNTGVWWGWCPVLATDTHPGNGFTEHVPYDHMDEVDLIWSQ